jgi:FkbM family methyltransferase
MGVVDRILRLPELRDAPPVLVDIGASGELHPKWREIARYSICVAFEPDEREAAYLTRASGRFRQLHLIRAAVTEQAEGESDFYLTNSPFCSSRLRPDQEALADYVFAPLFEVERTISLPTVDLPTALGELGLARVDWFKVDSQGTDLRLFTSLGEQISGKVLVAEFEPGIIDAYEGEDKLADLMRYMDEREFWPSEVRVQGSPRGKSELIRARFAQRTHPYLATALRPAPGWAEAEYFNEFNAKGLTERDFLLGFAFAHLRGHHAFALELAVRGNDRFDRPVFRELEEVALRRIRRSFARLPLTIARSFAGRIGT